MCPIDDDVQEYLADFTNKTRYQWKVYGKVCLYFSHIFPFISTDCDRVLEYFVDISRRFLITTWMRKMLHGPDNFFNATNSLKTLL